MRNAFPCAYESVHGMHVCVCERVCRCTYLRAHTCEGANVYAGPWACVCALGEGLAYEQVCLRVA